MPLGPDYGRDRPKHREYTPEQKAELEATFGRPIEELMALRDQDPRAGHNRDDQGRILDSQGNPREFVDPREQLLKEQASLAHAEQEPGHAEPDRPGETEAQPERTTPDTTQPTGQGDNPAQDQPDESDKATDLQAPSGKPDEPGTAENNDGGTPELEASQDLGGLASQLAADLRSGKLTPQQAAEQLEAFRDDLPAATTESTTETVRTERTPDGDLHYQRGTAEGIDDQPGDRTANEENDEVSERERKRNTLVEGTSNLLEDVEKIVDKAEKGLPPRLPPGTHGETTVRQPDVPTFETRQLDSPDAGNVIAGMLAASVAVIVLWGKATKRSRE